MAALMAAGGVTTCHFVPSMLAAFLDAPWQGLPALRRVVTSGEALPYELTRRFFERLPEVELHNLYGPTECAVDVTAWACRPDDPPGPVPIGKPVWNTRTYVLDARQAPVPVGVAGELYLGGVQVGRGYLDRPELTAERFVQTAFGRLYRTGDLARWRPDGCLEFLGRLDHQVKLRGFRIELGEIEAALMAQAAVKEAVVLLREDRPGDQRLVAYVIGEADRQALAAQLPAHMVPSAFVALEALPVTPNGKLDRKALPKPGHGTAPEAVAPRDAVEGALAAIFAEVLGLDQVGVDDDFFALGGHSLLVYRLLQLLRDRLGVVLPATTLFQHATVAGLAPLLGRAEPAALGPWVTFQAEGTRPPLVLVHPIEGEVLCFGELGRLLGPEQPVFAIRTDGQDGLPPTVEAQAARYLDLLPAGPIVLAGYSLGAVVAMEMAHQLAARGRPPALLVMLDPAQLDMGPPPSLEAMIAEISPRPEVSSLRPQDIERLGRVAIHHWELLRGYRARPYGGPLLPVFTDDDPGQARRRTWQALLPGAPWPPVVVPGTHQSFLRRPHVVELAAVLAGAIAPLPVGPS
jgi:enterobactin synthetase component F